MSHAYFRALAGTVAAAFLAPAAFAADEETSRAPAAQPAAAKESTAALAAPAKTITSLLAMKPVDLKTLASRRGGADVLNDMQLKGVVSDNRAVNVTTGNNVISDGAFAGTAGLPMVVQNTGNNVLIQNATIVNVQVK